MKARIAFFVHLKPGRQDDFLKAYGAIRSQVAEGVKGHILDQVCQSVEDPQWWLITSEWESLDNFVQWEVTEGHRDLVKPMRDCWDEAKSLKYYVREETGH